MRKMQNFHRICILGSLLLFEFMGCNRAEKFPQIVSTPTTEQPVSMESTTQQIGTPTATPTLTPIPTSTQTPTYTPRPPTSTPQSTLSPIKAKEAIFKLLENNGGCQLPCIWGITPGLTERKTAWGSLAKFGSKLFDSEQHISISRGILAGIDKLNFSFWEEQADRADLDYSFDFYYYYDIPQQHPIKQVVLDLSVVEGMNIVFTPHFSELTRTYSLPEILSQYGKPSSVQFAAFPDTSDDLRPPLTLLLIYEKDGFMVEYNIANKMIGDQYRGCPTASDITIRSWADRNDGAWQQALPDLRFGMYRDDLVAYFKPLEQATSLTLDEFYKTYKDPNDKSCLQTPVNLWSGIPPSQLTNTPISPGLKDEIMQLLANNGRCQLPCIWGITPGNDSYFDTKSILAHFGEVKSPELNTWHDYFSDCSSSGSCGSSTFEIFNNHLRYRSYLSYYYEDQKPINQLALNLDVDDGKDAVLGDFFYNQLVQFYSLHNILFQHGLPAKVLIAAFPQELDNPFPWRPFVILLVYEKEGFMAQYVMKKESVNDQYQGCPSKSLVSLTSWSSKDKEAWIEAVNRFSSSGHGINSENIGYFRPLDQATSLTLDQFYEIYKTSNNQMCLQTPTQLWPDSGQ
jgi:hypothetical protein